MKLIRIVGSLLPLAFLLPVLCLAQGSAQTDDIAKLREQIAAQQKQLTEQRQALESQQKALDSQQKLLDRLVAAQSAPAAAPAQPAAAALVPPAAPAAEVDAKGRAISPLAFHIGGADFTPGGFMDFSTVWRSTNIGSGVATSFAGVPMSNTAAGRIQEFRSSAANSRITLTITENPTKNTTVTGYLEGDFYGNQPTSLFVTSNANTFRMRHFWANAEKGKWEVLGGQTWTLLTPNRVGISQVSSNVFVALGEDSNYMTGLIWGRPGQIRVVYHPNKHWSSPPRLRTPNSSSPPASRCPRLPPLRWITGPFQRRPTCARTSPPKSLTTPRCPARRCTSSSPAFPASSASHPRRASTSTPKAWADDFDTSPGSGQELPPDCHRVLQQRRRPFRGAALVPISSSVPTAPSRPCIPWPASPASSMRPMPNRSSSLITAARISTATTR